MDGFIIQPHILPDDPTMEHKTQQVALGNHAKSSARKIEVIDEKTGEIQAFTHDLKRGEYTQDHDEGIRRFKRYELQNAAREILSREANPNGIPYRVTDCQRKTHGEEVGVLYSERIGKAHFSGLVTCGSVTTCSPCAAKISERRKAEIQAASDIHQEAGGGLYMVTITFSHKRTDDLEKMLKAFRAALSSLRAHRTYKTNNKALNYVGMIRALELTHGQANGWHPHLHELWFLAEPLSLRRVQQWKICLFDLWYKMCLKAGLGLPNRKVGIDITPATSAADYLSKFGHAQKWGVSSELTKSNTKQGRKESMTPWDMLRAYAEGDYKYAHLFREYARVFFGARQIYWTNGLKDAFGIKDFTDEELAAQQEEDAKLICRITKDKWRLILRQPYDARPVILKLAESGGYDALMTYLDGLVSSE